MIYDESALKRAEDKRDELYQWLQDLTAKLQASEVSKDVQEKLTGQNREDLQALEEEISDYKTLKKWKRVGPAELSDLGRLLYRCLHLRKIEGWEHKRIYKQLQVSSSRLSQDISAKFGNIRLARALIIFEVLKFEPRLQCIPIKPSSLPETFRSELPLKELGMVLTLLRPACKMSRRDLAEATDKEQSQISNKEKVFYLDSQLNFLVEISSFFMKKLSFSIYLSVIDLAKNATEQNEVREIDPEVARVALGTFDENQD